MRGSNNYKHYIITDKGATHHKLSSGFRTAATIFDVVLKMITAELGVRVLFDDRVPIEFILRTQTLKESEKSFTMW